AFAEITPDLTEAVLNEAAKICEGVLLPLNRSGDEEGCTLENGVVRTPAGFKDAWNQFTQGGWNALVLPTQWGGQGLPEAVGKLVEEMICATN
ncbi:acyl-CoA dehydrogenase, partial [Parvimonas micra]|nr:acyl-CoA dehydrogenase [Parvimonas micra]